MASQHLDVVATSQPNPHAVLLVARTTQSELRIAEAVRTLVCRDAAASDEFPRRLVREPARIVHELELQLRAGEPVAVEKVVALVTSHDVAISDRRGDRRGAAQEGL